MTYPRTVTVTRFGSKFLTAPVSGTFFELTSAGDFQNYALTKELVGDQMSACAYGEMIPRGITSLVVDGSSTVEAAYDWANADRAAIYQGGFVPAGNGNAVFEVDPVPIAGPDCALLGGAE